MTKKRLMKIVIEKVKDDKKGIEELLKFFGGMPALLFTKDDPYVLSKIIQKNMSNAPIKEGQTAPNDIIIKAGPTPFSPGPIIGELGMLKVKATIEGGKVVIKNDTLVVKEGDVVGKKLADILTRLGEEPMKIGLNLVAVYDKGEILTKDVLFVDEQEYLDKIALANSWALNLAMESGYVTGDTIKIFLSKAYHGAVALAVKTNIVTDETIKNLLAKAEAEANMLKAKEG
jgi:large subunit ribosomal protein L10